MRKTTMKSSGPMAPPAKSSLIATGCSSALCAEVFMCFPPLPYATRHSFSGSFRNVFVLDGLASPVQCSSHLRLRLVNSPVHQRLPCFKVRSLWWRKQSLAEFGHRVHQFIKRWLVWPGGVVTRSLLMRRERSKDGRRQRIQDEGNGSRVDVLTN